MRIIITGVFALLTRITWGQEEPKLVLPIGHLDGIGALAFSPNGKQIATASGDGTAKIWEAVTGKLIRSLEDVYSSCVRYSPDGKRIITISSKDYSAKIWDSANGNLLQILKGHSGNIPRAYFSPNGKLVVTVSFDKTAKIWETVTGKLIHTLTGHRESVFDAAFSSDGKYIVTTSSDQTANLWNTQTGTLLHTMKGHTFFVSSAQFSPDNKYVLTEAGLDAAKIWEVASGNLIHSLDNDVSHTEFSPDGKLVLTKTNSGKLNIWSTITGMLFRTWEGTGKVISASFSPDGKQLAVVVDSHSVEVSSIITGEVLYTLQGRARVIYHAEHSPDAKFIVTAGDRVANIWETKTGKHISTLRGRAIWINSAHFSSDGEKIITSQEDSTTNLIDFKSGKILSSLQDHRDSSITAILSPDSKYIFTVSQQAKIWEVETGKLLQSLTGHIDQVNSLKLSADGSSLVTTSNDSTVNIWSAPDGKMMRKLNGHKSGVVSASFSPDKKNVATNSTDGAKIWEVSTGNLLHSLSGHSGWVWSSSFSPDGKFLTTTDEKTARLWEVSSGKMIHKLSGHRSHVYSARFSMDGKRIVTASSDSTANVYETASGKLLNSLRHEQDVSAAQFSANGNYIVTRLVFGPAKIWDAASGKMIHALETGFNGYGKGNFSTELSPDGKFLLTASGANLEIWDVQSGKLLCRWVEIDKNDWVVTHPSGLFDASPVAMDKLYFVQGLDIIDFNQLKERYYEPGLWKKVMAGEPLRNVVGMKSIDLPPDIQVGQVDSEGYLNINLTNRGGGIGEVNLFVNGKEVIKDARDANVKPDAPNASIKVFVGKHKSIVKGQENIIAVKAWNKDHWVQSRGQVISYQSKEIESYKPAVHILTCGVSDYTGNEIDLKYAAKDANDVSVALQLGAKKLFGAERSYVYNLTTTQAKEFYPTKTNILKTFEKITSTAHPLDIFVMYVSGHGINYGGQDGDWHYLTQEAYTGSGAAYNDPAIRAQTTISSNELVELFKKVPALKQVLMLDACASGKVVDNLIAQKDIESSTLRALDRMRDRTGMHIITGCTADAVSYEASKYGQGVLTYSLLEGIRGAALREDQYVDVNKLFQYAQDRVPQLAEGIGGIQSPQVFSPQGSQSFDIGLLSDVEKKEIPIAKIRPVYIRSNFQDENEMEDVLGIGKAVDESLNEASAKGIEAQLIFVDVREYPDACKLIGRYRKEGSQILLKLRKKCGSEDKTFDLKASDVYGLKAEVLKIL